MIDFRKNSVEVGKSKEKKIGNFGRFFGDFSVIGWSGKKKSMEKSFEKISAKKSRFFGKNRKNSDI